jgi:hypothetical protein
VSHTRDSLERLGRPLRLSSSTAWLLAGLAAVGAVLGVAAWSIRLNLGGPAAVGFMAWVAVLVAVASLVWLGRREVRKLGPRDLARALEQAGAARRGALRAQLEPPAEGTSTGLAQAADASWAAEVEAHGGAALRPLSRRLHRRALVLGLAALVAVSALAVAKPGSGRAAILWHPAQLIGLLRAPVRLKAEPELVERGGEVSLRLEAEGQRSATLYTRAPGQPWLETSVLLDSLGRGERRIEAIESDMYFLLSAGSRQSDTVHVRVRIPAFLGALRLTAHYPEYLNLEDEPLPVSGDTLMVPAGTTLDTEGEASTAIGSAAWTGPGSRAELAPQGRRFTGQLVPRRSGTYTLSLVTEDGNPLAGDPMRLPLVVVPDSTPVVEVPVPGADTIAPLDLRIPLLIDAHDDHGITRVEVVSRAGTGNPLVEAVPLAEATRERVLAEFILDLSARQIRPGDTVRYRVRAADNHPQPQTGQSREFIVVIPNEEAQRQAQRQAAEQARRQLDSLVASSRRLERQSDDLTRERARAEGQGREQQALGFEEKRRSEAVARSQEELLRQADELRETLEAMEEAAERGEEPDTALARRLAEIGEQLERALTPELRQKLAELQKSLQSLDPQQAREALKQLSEAQQALREALERTRELFKRAALEAEMKALAEDAGDLAAEQKQWNEKIPSADSSQAAAQERALASQADSLAAGLQRAAQQMDQADARQQMNQTAQQAKQAAQQMRSAASSAQRGQRQQAQQQGQQAQAQMEQVERETAEQRDQQQESWRKEVLEALDRALAETAQLSRQQLDVTEGFRRGATLAAARRELGTVEESAQKLLEQATALAGKNALVSPQIAVALAVARRNMALARDAVSSASPNLREATDRSAEAVDALNAAAFQMVRSREEVSGSSSGSGLAEALEKMTQMAQQQGQLSQQAGGLLPMAGSAAIQEQLRQMAAQQRALAREMERMRAEGQIPAAQELAEEARELARKLEASQLDRETVQRQERLFRRMLDAGRTLRGEEEDERKERQSTAAKEGEVRLPPALRRRLGDENSIRFPTWDELQQLSPDERRMVTEYFRRLAARTGR